MSHPIPGHDYAEEVNDFIPDTDEDQDESEIDETEPGGIPFDPGDPLKDYRDEEVRSLNAR